jgi:hypothetical protein
MTEPADDIPDFATLAADPEIAPLLGFDPVPRQVKRPNGWTPDLQRELIARLAATGTLQQAVSQMGKHATGAEALYKVRSADSFRAAWDDAVAIGRRRQGLDCGPPHPGPVPGIQRRVPRAQAPEPEPEPGEADDSDLRLELVERLVAKFQRKVGQERECRLAGEIVAADFYLRQVTCLEVAFDLMIDGHGTSGWEMLMQARRGERNMLEIADTYLARVLDQARRDQWAAMAEPARPEAWPERYLLGDAGKVDARLEPLENIGKITRAPAGVPLNEWCRLSPEEQQQDYADQHRRDAAEQIRWEAEGAAQSADWQARNPAPGPSSPLEGEGRVRGKRKSQRKPK